MDNISHRNLTAYLMDAQQDLTVRNGHVYDNTGHEVWFPRVRKSPRISPQIWAYQWTSGTDTL